MSHTLPTETSPATTLGTPVSWADPARAAMFAHWLGGICLAQQLVPATLRFAAADADFRRYLRIDTSAGSSRIIMDAPPDKLDTLSFVKIADLFRSAGLHTPRVLAWDQALGFMLLTDLGRHTMMDQLNPGDAQANLPRYLQAVDELIKLQTASRPDVLPPYNDALLRRELQLFPDWYVAQHRGITLSAAQKAVLDKAFASIVADNLATPSVYVHRDFMPRNLMATTPDSLGVLDFQDAVYGPVTYDIASLMRDAFLSWEEDFVLEVTVRYWERARKVGLMNHDDWHGNFGAFYRAVEYMGLQRHLKVAGIFARLTLRDGKAKYLADAPRFINYIRATAHRYRELGPLLKLMDEIEGNDTANTWIFGRPA